MKWEGDFQVTCIHSSVLLDSCYQINCTSAMQIFALQTESFMIELHPSWQLLTALCTCCYTR